MERIGDDPITQVLHRALTVAARRQQATAGNIANADTPGYRTQGFDFQKALRMAAEGAPDSVLRDVLRGETITGLRIGNDGNNVDMDREMLHLAQTSGFYSTAIALLRRQAALLRYAVSEGRS